MPECTLAIHIAGRSSIFLNRMAMGRVLCGPGPASWTMASFRTKNAAMITLLQWYRCKLIPRLLASPSSKEKLNCNWSVRIRSSSRSGWMGSLSLLIMVHGYVYSKLLRIAGSCPFITHSMLTMAFPSIEPRCPNRVQSRVRGYG